MFETLDKDDELKSEHHQLSSIHPIPSKPLFFPKVNRTGKFSLQTSERTEIYSAAGVSSFTGNLPGSRVPVPPAADQVGRAGADHLTSFERTNKGKSCDDGDSSFARLMAWLKALVLPSPCRAGLVPPGRTGCGSARRPARS